MTAEQPRPFRVRREALRSLQRWCPTTEHWPQIADLLHPRALPLEGAKEHLEDFLVAVESGKVLGASAREPVRPGAGPND